MNIILSSRLCYQYLKVLIIILFMVLNHLIILIFLSQPYDINKLLCY